jgi:hypothetical protein
MKKFNLFLFSISLLLLSASALFDINFISYESPIPYSSVKSINFYDFRGLRKPGETLYGATKFAFIKTSREYRIINDSSAWIISLFHPSRSYIYDQQIRNNGLLQHELYHFHITEYFSRMTRRQLANTPRPLKSEVIEAFINQYQSLEAAMQQEYDNESWHGYVLKEQKKWEYFTDSALASLVAYADPMVILK